MARAYGKGVICGREVRVSSSGKKASFRVNSSTREKNRETGEWGYENCYFNVDVVGPAVTNAIPILQPGNLISFEGEIKMDEWEKDGKKFSQLKVLCVECPGLVPTGKGHKNRSASPQVSPATEYVDDDELPF